MKAHKLAVLILLAAPLMTRAALPALPSPVQAKTDLEKKVVDEVTGILDRFLGPGRAHVTVFLNVEVKAAADAAVPAKKNERKDKNVEAKWMWREISKKPKMSVLPGFAVNPDVTMTDNKKTEPKPAAAPAPDDGDQPAYEIAVKRMLVSIVIDSSVPDKSEKMIEVMVSEVLGLDPDRGDRLNMYKLPLQPAWKSTLDTPETTMRIFWGVIAIAALIVLLFFYTRSVQAVDQARSLLPQRMRAKSEKSSSESAAVESRRSAGSGEDGVARDESGGGQARSEDASAAPATAAEAEAIAKQRLDFVSLDNFEMLSELLKDSDPKDVACLLGFVDPILSSRILDQLPHEKRIETMMYLVSATSIPPQELAEIRRAWRERLAYAYGGTGAVGELLSSMEPAMQKMFLERLKTVSPELLPKVSEALIRMDDLARLEPGDLAQLAQAVPFEDWAKALAPMAQSYKDRVLAALPDTSRQVLQQWLSLTKPKKVEADMSQSKVLSTLRSMIRAGRVALTKDPVPAPRAGGTLAAAAAGGGASNALPVLKPLMTSSKDRPK
jgi:hypothetical protein